MKIAIECAVPISYAVDVSVVPLFNNWALEADDDRPEVYDGDEKEALDYD